MTHYWPNQLGMFSSGYMEGPYFQRIPNKLADYFFISDETLIFITLKLFR
jgi:hypothetical protein